MSYLTPRIWEEDELAAYRLRAESLFREERKNEGPRSFAQLYAICEPRVWHALQVTNYAQSITAEILIADPLLWQLLRYFCAPPTSEEDLWTMVGAKFRRMPPDVAEETALAILDCLDFIRFPWVEQRRTPTDAERASVLLATTQLVTYERLRTARRGQAAAIQEAYIARQLAEAGFALNPSRASIYSLDDLERGSFSRERKLAGEKCDVPVRLRDGRLLALECKVSNGPKNGWKRLHRDVVGKAEFWGTTFGRQVITAAVVAGAYDLSCLVKAQERGIFLFWQQDVTSLLEFVTQATSQ